MVTFTIAVIGQLCILYWLGWVVIFMFNLFLLPSVLSFFLRPNSGDVLEKLPRRVPAP